jgi:phage gpG-like protein
MLDISEIYERAAFNLAAELQGYIGLNMKPMSAKNVKSGLVPRNPEKGIGTLRLLSGNLYRSFAPKKSSAGNIFIATTDGNNFTFTYGSSIVYAAIHEYGGRAGRGGSAKIPKRPYFAPAIKEWKKERLPEFKRELKLEIIREMKSWLANQKQLKK